MEAWMKHTRVFATLPQTRVTLSTTHVAPNLFARLWQKLLVVVISFPPISFNLFSYFLPNFSVFVVDIPPPIFYFFYFLPLLLPFKFFHILLLKFLPPYIFFKFPSLIFLHIPPPPAICWFSSLFFSFSLLIILFLIPPSHPIFLTG